MPISYPTELNFTQLVQADAQTMPVSCSVEPQLAPHKVESAYFGTDVLDVEVKIMEGGPALYWPRKRQEGWFKGQGTLLTGNKHCFIELVADSFNL